LPVKKRRITEKDYIKAVRKASREAEIEAHGKPITSNSHVFRSKRAYDRKKLKAVFDELS
jgi:hypothetical protein